MDVRNTLGVYIQFYICTTKYWNSNSNRAIKTTKESSWELYANLIFSGIHLQYSCIYLFNEFLLTHEIRWLRENKTIWMYVWGLKLKCLSSLFWMLLLPCPKLFQYYVLLYQLSQIMLYIQAFCYISILL